MALGPFDPLVAVETPKPAALGGQDDHGRAHRTATAQARLLVERPLQLGQDRVSSGNGRYSEFRIIPSRRLAPVFGAYEIKGAQ